jgi:hypothetical protein
VPLVSAALQASEDKAMIDITEIQRIIKDGADIREDSYHAINNYNGQISGEYTKTCMEACVEASPNNPEIGWIIGLALDGWWNDALDWANKPHI